MTAASEPAGGTAASTLGARLQAVREAARLEPQGLAHLINLDVKIIDALERGDYAALPPPLYVKGYLRSIAKQLGVDAAALLAAYEQERAHIEDPKLVGFASRPAIQLTSSSLRVRFITTGLVLTLLALVAIWWRNYYVPAEVRTPPPSAADAFDLPAPNEPLSVGAMPEQGITPEGVPPGGPDQVQAEVAAPDMGTAGVMTPAEPPPANSVGAAPATTEPVSPVPPAASAQPGNVTLELSQDVWISISDARGERLYYDTARAGQTVAVAGQPPYQLVIGNTGGVRLSFGGENIDLTAYERLGVARLTLGAPPVESAE